jgi:maltooligosyltrehalose trehalohydrolase
LNWEERDTHAHIYRLHRDLLRLRRTDAAFSAQAPGAVDGAVLEREAFVLRFAAATPDEERLLVVNLGPDLAAASFAEPLVAPPAARDWHEHWSSEHPDYGGSGTPPVAGPGGWRVPGHAAIVLKPGDVHDRDGTRGR